MTIIFPNNDPTVHIQHSLRPFRISEEVQFKNWVRSQKTVPFLLSLLPGSYYSPHRNRLGNNSFSSSTTLLLHLLRHSTIWWHVGDAPPHTHTQIHQSLGHEIACVPTKLPRWFVCDCILDFFFKRTSLVHLYILNGIYACMPWVVGCRFLPQPQENVSFSEHSVLDRKEVLQPPLRIY